MRKVKSAALFLSVACVSLVTVNSAFAGKPERDKIDETKPHLTEIQGQVKAACGCDVPVNVDWASYASVDQMGMIGYSADSWASAAKSYCEKDADKKALCENVTEVSISFATTGSPEVKLSTKKITVTSTLDSYAPDSWYTEVLNKF